ncbi:hypothetical protein CYMTET_21840 [Cymbomonas tetramitiformis]|uniref:Uncharacterized protein n=1 Tax=Cymbomonas tetramitiformis TaxID=36881 RepID=A0AAE0L2I5_9CHLO|nr:hypothetical protein CYMTET_21840 [Cymbomonas tetramitiformis]
MSTEPIRSKISAISLYDVFAHVCSTDNNLAARRLNGVLRGGQTDVPVIRSIIETKTAYTTFPESAKVRPTPIITYTSQCDSVLEEFTKIFEKGAKYNKTASITQPARLKTFTTDTYPGLHSLLQPSTTTDALPLSSHTAPPPPTTLPAPVFLNPTDIPPRLRAPFAQYHDISVTGPTLTAFTTAAVVTELPQQLLLHTCAIFHRKNKPQKGYVKEVWVCKCSEDPFRSSKTRVDLRPSQGTTSTASVPRPATTSTACGCTASFSITPVKPKTGDPATQIVKVVAVLAHTGHSPGTATDLASLNLLPEVYRELVQICRLHNQSTFQIKRAHKHFLKGFVPTLGLAYADLDQDVDHRFFPFPSDIKNAINEAARASRHAQLGVPSDPKGILECIGAGGHRFLESSQEVLATGGLREVIQPLVPDILSRTPPPPPFLRIEQPSTDLCLPESHPSVSEMQEIVKHLIQPLPHFASKEFLVIDLDQFTTSLTAPFLPTNPLHLPFHQQKCLFAFVHEPAGEWRLFVLDGEVSHTVYVFDPSGPRHIPPTCWIA